MRSLHVILEQAVKVLWVLGITLLFRYSGGSTTSGCTLSDHILFGGFTGAGHRKDGTVGCPWDAA